MHFEVWKEHEKIGGVSMDYRDMRGEAGGMMVGRGLCTRSRPLGSPWWAACGVASRPVTTGLGFIEKSVSAKRTQLENVEVFWNE